MTKLIGKYCSWLGMLNWLAISTHPDLAPVVYLLSSYQSAPSPSHLKALKHVGKYLKATLNLGIVFSSLRNGPLEAFIHFPLSDSAPDIPLIDAFTNANWGPQDASISLPHVIPRQVSVVET